MIRNIREAQNREEGFTLIELLVVVIIIGILAAIAIPSFLNQRERAWQAEATSHLRNAALEIEADATANAGTYPIDADGNALADTFEDNGTALTYIANAAQTAFCMYVTHTRVPGEGQTYRSAANGLLDWDSSAAPTTCTP